MAGQYELDQQGTQEQNVYPHYHHLVFLLLPRATTLTQSKAGKCFAFQRLPPLGLGKLSLSPGSFPEHLALVAGSTSK